MKKSSLLILVFFIISVNKIYSCSCAQVSVVKNFNDSDLVFTGKVVEINMKEMVDSIPTNNSDKKFRIRKYKRIEFKFEVINLYKGNIKNEHVSIFTTGGISDCGNYFQLDSEHLVYSYIQEIRLNDFETDRTINPFYTTNLCTRTKELKKTKQNEIKEIQKLSDEK